MISQNIVLQNIDPLDINKHIDKHSKIQKQKMYKSIKYGIIELIKYIKNNKLILFGKSALEIYNGGKLSIPIYCISDDIEKNKEHKVLFQKVKYKYNILFKIDIVKPIHSTFFKMNLLDVFRIYNTSIIKNCDIMKHNNFFIVKPIISLINNLFHYSTPIHNNNKWIESFDDYYKYISSIKINNVSQKSLESSYLNKNIINLHESIDKLLNDDGYYNSEYILISGFKSLNKILKTNYKCYSCDFLICENRLENELIKLKNIFNKDNKKVLNNIVNNFKETDINHDIYDNSKPISDKLNNSDKSDKSDNSDKSDKSDKSDNNIYTFFNSDGLSLKIFNNKVFNYFSKVCKIYYKNINIITFYFVREAYSFNTKLKTSNFHTTALILLYKYLITNNKYYLIISEILLSKSKNIDLLENNNFKSFQNIYIKDCVSDLLIGKNKIFF